MPKREELSFRFWASEGMCKRCYRRFVWQRKKVECARCKRQLPMHAKGFCAGCYNSVFQLDKVKESNARRYHGIEPEVYKKVTQICVSCGFDKLVDLHHLDHDKTNRSETNLVGLCPNCHKMLHTKKYQAEIFNNLRQKGYQVPEGNTFDNFFKKKFSEN